MSAAARHPAPFVALGSFALHLVTNGEYGYFRDELYYLFLWGLRGATGEVMIVVGGDLEDHAGDFERVEHMAVVRCRYCMPYEDGVRLYVGRGLKRPLPVLWPEVKKYI